ncbi:hypothetical protein Q6350_07975 [Isoptericola sp. b515]|uniref:hypothetical protein n=1 Tax=Isoptericola sp. b515 TaxID=3064652 RepID=UPI002712F945|nr:hypothetical protein [Isoptericola sp. b515]MDO8148365.1 hypothetical protein [Isoptericola sp. b515]
MDDLIGPRYYDLDGMPISQARWAVMWHTAERLVAQTLVGADYVVEVRWVGVDREEVRHERPLIYRVTVHPLGYVLPAGADDDSPVSLLLTDETTHEESYPDRATAIVGHDLLVDSVRRGLAAASFGTSGCVPLRDLIAEPPLAA